MPAPTPYLMFDGTCLEAMRCYERVLGGRLEVMRYGDAPEEMRPPPGSEDRVMHAHLPLPDGGALMASDCLAGMPHEPMAGAFVSLQYPNDVTTVRRRYDALADGGRIVMPLQKTFWSESFGMLVDRYGTHWMLSA